MLKRASVRGSEFRSQTHIRRLTTGSGTLASGNPMPSSGFYWIALMHTHKIKYNLKKQKQKSRTPSRDSAALSQRLCPSPGLGATSSQRLWEHQSPMRTQERVLPGPVAFFPENLNFDLLNQNDPENDDDIKKKSITMMKQGMAWSLSKSRVTLGHSAFCGSYPRAHLKMDKHRS